MAIDPSLIEEIKSRADIVDIISSYISVVKKGRNYFAVCPFHDDHNPSLSISKDKGIFKCFVCGTSGDVFGFVSKYDNISYFDAIKRVAELINYDDPRLHQNEFKVKVDESKAVLYKCANDLNEFYQYGLSVEEGQVARAYLMERGINEEQIKKFALGYALSDGTKSIEFLKKKNYSLKNIEDIGISLVKTSGMKDSNAGRLIFPIRDISGQVVGYSARKLNNDNKDEAKYVNTAETKIFSKGNILYNMNNAKESMKRDGYLYVVEGFMDVFALDSIGVHSVVGLMGTAMTKNNVQNLRRANVEIRLCLDNDNAGQIAMMGIIKQFDEAGINYRIVSDPNEAYKDSDEILHVEGAEHLRSYINKLVDKFSFALSYYKNTSPLTSQSDKYKVVNYFTPMLLNTKNTLERDDYIYKLSAITGFDPKAIKDHLKTTKVHEKQADKVEFIAFKSVPRLEKSQLSKDLIYLKNAEKHLLNQMFLSKEAIEFYEKDVKYFSDETFRLIANFIIDYAKTHNNVDLSSLITMVELSEIDNKEDLINEISSIGVDPSVKLEPKEVLNDYYTEIKKRRNKIYEKELYKKALDGKSEQEKARILDDYIKRTNNN